MLLNEWYVGTAWKKMRWNDEEAKWRKMSKGWRDHVEHFYFKSIFALENGITLFDSHFALFCHHRDSLRSFMSDVVPARDDIRHNLDFSDDNVIIVSEAIKCSIVYIYKYTISIFIPSFCLRPHRWLHNISDEVPKWLKPYYYVERRM